MKKVLAIVLSALLLVDALVGCASKSEPASNDNNASADTAASTDGKLETLKVGASSTPHAEILEQVKDTLAAEGYDLQIVIYDDYVLPNQSLADGSLDANYFQHTPYLNSFQRLQRYRSRPQPPRSTMSRSASMATTSLPSPTLLPTRPS